MTPAPESQAVRAAKLLLGLPAFIFGGTGLLVYHQTGRAIADLSLLILLTLVGVALLVVLPFVIHRRARRAG